MPQKHGPGRDLADFLRSDWDHQMVRSKAGVSRGSTLRVALRFCGMNAALRSRQTHRSGLILILIPVPAAEPD